jgi:hypothetical protein
MLIPTRIALATFIAACIAVFISACGGGSSCAEGAYKNAETGICIKLPADFKADDKVMKSGESQYVLLRHAKTFKTFSVWIEKSDDLDKRAKTVENMASSSLVLVEKGDTSPGKGKFFHFHNPQGNYEFAVALVPGKAHFYRCEVQNTPIEDAKPMIEACKTLSGP